MAVVLPFTFTNGTVADAIQVNANFSALLGGVNLAQPAIVTLERTMPSTAQNAPSSAINGGAMFPMNSITLTSGDWDLHGYAEYVLVTDPGITVAGAAIAFDTDPAGWGLVASWTTDAVQVNVGHVSARGGPYRVQLTTPTVIYVLGYTFRMVFTAGNITSVTFRAGMFARRMGDAAVSSISAPLHYTAQTAPFETMRTVPSE